MFNSREHKKVSNTIKMQNYQTQNYLRNIYDGLFTSTKIISQSNDPKLNQITNLLGVSADSLTECTTATAHIHLDCRQIS